ncbi:acyltransferase family-domain-containing protein [Hyaloscypha finlandica]|nr:acyltransferase family-domain-containing protein [Hyaloscypha finlandica]
MLRILYFLLVPLLPSPLQALLPADPAKPRILRKIHPTSYLDGLRGVAALIVLQSHFLTNWFYPLRSGYLNTESDTHLLQLPILRLLYAGRASVAVFFVVSGFVLSYKPLLLARSSNQGAVLQTLSSSVFRRGFRLWIPIVFGTFISALLAYNDLYTPVPNRGELIPPVFPTLREQLWHWWGDLCIFWFPWKATVDGNDTVGFAYNGHLWTIPIEFYGSIVVFVTVLGLSGMNRGHGWMRIAIGTGLVGWSLRGGRWDAALFLGGMVCAEWSLMIEIECSLPGSQALHALLRISKKALTALRLHLHPFIRLLKALKDLSLVILLFTSLFLLSYAGESASPGYYHNFLIPYTPSIWESVALGHEHFWLCIGALLLLFTLTNSPTMQRPFTWALPQYLGDVSYSLYIVHGMVLFTLGTSLQEKWTGAVGKIEWVDNGAGDLVGCAVVNWMVIFWCADLFWRAVDGRVPGWGRSVEGLVSGRRRGRGR